MIGDAEQRIRRLERLARGLGRRLDGVEDAFSLAGPILELANRAAGGGRPPALPEPPCRLRVCVNCGPEFDVPVSGASVAIKHDGSTVATGTTGSDGCVTFDLGVGDTLPAGAWIAEATFTYGGDPHTASGEIVDPCGNAFLACEPDGRPTCLTCPMPDSFEGTYGAPDDPFTMAAGAWPFVSSPAACGGAAWISNTFYPSDILGGDVPHRVYICCDGELARVYLVGYWNADFADDDDEFGIRFTSSGNLSITSCSPLDAGTSFAVFFE